MNNIFETPIPCNFSGIAGNTHTTAREVWKKAPKASARKATAEGVKQICIEIKEGKFYIFQISGYTSDRGIFCDLLNERGQVIG